MLCTLEKDRSKSLTIAKSNVFMTLSMTAMNSVYDIAIIP